MSRRKQNGDQEFGSDSFLDIIANIVGILIILIVIAGMKVARQPAEILNNTAQAVLVETPLPEGTISSAEAVLPVPESPVVTHQDDTSTPEFSTDDSVAATVAELPNPFAAFESDTATTTTEDALRSRLPTDGLHDDGESTALNQQIDSLTLDVENVGLEIDASQDRLAELMQQLETRAAASGFSDSRVAGLIDEQKAVLNQIEAIEQQLGVGEKQSEGFQTTLTSLADRQQYITQALKQVSHETRRLQEVLNETEDNDVSEDRLQHRISPVSRDATSDELHFQLAGGKVAHIPLEQLLDRLKDQVSQRRNIVQKFYRSEGIVGPVGGFRMNYIVERQAVAPLQSLQYGGNAFRITVSRWTILPAETLEAETVDAAVKIGSRFRQVVESAEPNTVLTIWLYPDDFSKFGALRELAHRFNLRVAARPLPPGTPIAGSPSGSRSASQ